VTNRVRVVSPGRVNLIGDHTDYTGGLVFPMAIDRATVIEGTRGGDRIELQSADESEHAVVALDEQSPEHLKPSWARYVGGVVSELSPLRGLKGRVSTTVPIGAGLSSSAALELAVALALGFEGTPAELALLCQRAEHRASGVPCGIMDQLCIAAGVEGHALMIDCHTLSVTPTPLPADTEVLIVYGHHRTLVGSEYATRVHECVAAEAAIGPLRLASVNDTFAIADDTVRARARHVISENERVRRFADALAAGDRDAAGRLMVESHNSLSSDYDTSTPQMDKLVAELVERPGVYGARITGGGFGGCAVALVRTGSVDPSSFDRAWLVQPSAGARVV
jgi:galactokinase